MRRRAAFVLGLSLACRVAAGADSPPGERVVVPWEDGLAVLSLPTNNPMGDDALIKLKPAGEHRFRRIRADGSLGEEVVFEMGPDGVPARMLRHSNYAVRVR